jgi:hypothetical protein
MRVLLRHVAGHLYKADIRTGLYAVNESKLAMKYPIKDAESVERYFNTLRPHGLAPLGAKLLSVQRVHASSHKAPTACLVITDKQPTDGVKQAFSLGGAYRVRFVAVGDRKCDVSNSKLQERIGHEVTEAQIAEMIMIELETMLDEEVKRLQESMK